MDCGNDTTVAFLHSIAHMALSFRMCRVSYWSPHEPPPCHSVSVPGLTDAYGHLGAPLA